MSFTDTYAGTSAGYSARSTNPWITNPQAELLNGLCSGKEAAFPRFTWLPRKHRGVFMEACSHAFFVVKDHVETLMFEKLTDAEKGVFLTIQRKTLRYNKLMETIGRKAFYQGHCEQDGTLKLNAMRNVMLPPGVPNCSAVSKGVNGLLKKGLISRMECSRADSEQKVYSAGPLEIIVPLFFDEAYLHFLERIDGATDQIGNSFLEQLYSSFGPFMQENSLEWIHIRQFGA
ncbi:hypothetical protein [Rhizobium ruizarguesonis]|uniref:hypothetical protein n=1 Tax=Rhizobium ruizarguesonis TaxID=2081791 RepID=UPI0010319706|nr:hypothetical protein [Rhizobium ruizarguesonis]TBC51041.1 hypothetical protein ELH29_15310 [Rhizobium ruizarguesonis]